MKTKEIILNNVTTKLKAQRNPNPAQMAGRSLFENGKSSFFKKERDFSRRNVSHETGRYNENTFCEINVPSRGRDNRPVSRLDARFEPCNSEYMRGLSVGRPEGNT